MAKPRKIMHVITTTMVGGAEVQLMRLIAASDPGRFEHTVVGLGPEGPLAQSLRQAGAEVISLGLKPTATALPKGVGQLARLIGKIRPDLVQGWMYHANLLGLIAARLTGVRPVLWGVFCSDMDMKQYSLGARLLFKACVLSAKQPGAIVSNSQVGVEFHVGLGYPRDTQLVISNGFDTENYRPDAKARAELRAQLGLSEDQVLIGNVARFDPMKDHAAMLAAAAQVAVEFPQARFITLGLDMEPGNPALAAALAPPLAGRFFLKGSQHDVPRWLAAMDLHLSSSVFGEGFSNTVGEAMAVGLPNVVTDVGDSARLVGDTGLVTASGQPGQLAAALKELLLLSGTERKNLGLLARRRIMENFSLEVMARAYQDLYYRFLPAN